MFLTLGARAGNRTEPPLPPGPERDRGERGPAWGHWAVLTTMGTKDGSQPYHVPAQASQTLRVPSINPPAEAGVQLPSAWCFLFDKIPLHGGPKRLNKD